jgi:TPR repeat protein
MLNIGVLYANGQGVTQDYGKAREWYERASAAGSSTAMRNIGILYEYGQGVVQDYGKARAWYEKAAAAGDAVAMRQIGILNAGGQGIPQNFSAREWFEKAATAGDTAAMVGMGLLYENGDGVVQNYGTAREWYEKAAELGSALANRHLAGLFLEGKGVGRDFQKAMALYEEVGKSGDANAWNSASWAALFAKDFLRALANADQALKLDPSSLVVATNRAHALMLVGRLDEARALYLAHRNKKMPGDKLWEQVIAEDFAELQKEGVNHPLMKEIARTLASKKRQRGTMLNGDPRELGSDPFARRLSVAHCYVQACRGTVPLGVY